MRRRSGSPLQFSLQKCNSSSSSQINLNVITILEERIIFVISLVLSACNDFRPLIATLSFIGAIGFHGCAYFHTYGIQNRNCDNLTETLTPLLANAVTVHNIEAADDRYTTANLEFRRKEYDAAIKKFTGIISDYPKHTASYLGRANAYIALMKYDKAFQDYDLAIRVDDKSSNAYFGRATLKVLLGRLSEAEADYRRAIEITPDDSFIYARLAKILYDQRKASDVVSLYGEAYRSNSCRQWALWGWLSALEESESFWKLARTINGLDEIGTRSPAVDYYAGFLNIRDANYMAAVDRLKKAVEFESPETPVDAYSRLACAYKVLKDDIGYVKYMGLYIERSGEQIPGIAFSNIGSGLKEILRDAVHGGHDIVSISFVPKNDPDPGWLVVYGKRGRTEDYNGFRSHKLPDSLYAKLYELYKDRRIIRQVAIGESDGWVISHDQGRFLYRGLYRDADRALNESKSKGEPVAILLDALNDVAIVTIRDLYGSGQKFDLRLAIGETQLRYGIKTVAVTPNGGWIISSYGGYQWKSVPSDLLEVLKDWNDTNASIDLIAFAPNGGWVAYSKPLADDYASSTCINELLR